MSVSSLSLSGSNLASPVDSFQLQDFVCASQFHITWRVLSRKWCKQVHAQDIRHDKLNTTVWVDGFSVFIVLLNGRRDIETQTESTTPESTNQEVKGHPLRTNLTMRWASGWTNQVQQNMWMKIKIVVTDSCSIHFKTSEDPWGPNIDRSDKIVERSSSDEKQLEH